MIDKMYNDFDIRPLENDHNNSACHRDVLGTSLCQSLFKQVHRVDQLIDSSLMILPLGM